MNRMNQYVQGVQCQTTGLAEPVKVTCKIDEIRLESEKMKRKRFGESLIVASWFDIKLVLLVRCISRFDINAEVLASNT